MRYVKVCLILEFLQLSKIQSLKQNEIQYLLFSFILQIHDGVVLHRQETQGKTCDYILSGMLKESVLHASGHIEYCMMLKSKWLMHAVGKTNFHEYCILQEMCYI